MQKQSLKRSSKNEKKTAGGIGQAHEAGCGSTGPNWYSLEEPGLRSPTWSYGSDDKSGPGSTVQLFGEIYALGRKARTIERKITHPPRAARREKGGKVRFAKPEKQAVDAAKELAAHGTPRAETRHTGKNSSLRTEGSFKDSMKNFLDHCRQTDPKASIDTVTPEQARAWLDTRATKIGQSQLNADRVNVNKWFSHRDGVKDAIPRADYKDKAQVEPRLAAQPRYYTPQQVEKIAGHQSEAQGLATRIAHAGGLRAKELLTLAKPDEQPPNAREWRPDMHTGKGGEPYTVQGKGGLIREVRIPQHLAKELETRRLAQPQSISDRCVNYQTKYDLPGGNKWSASFTRASERALGWTAGAHGLRHSYAQERMDELQEQGRTWEDARELLSQELGHFRPDITDAYLR